MLLEVAILEDFNNSLQVTEGAQSRMKSHPTQAAHFPPPPYITGLGQKSQGRMVYGTKAIKMSNSRTEFGGIPLLLS